MWKPKKLEFYYYVETNGKVGQTQLCDMAITKGMVKVHNCFKTKKKAEIAAKKFREILNDMQED